MPITANATPFAKYIESKTFNGNPNKKIKGSTMFTATRCHFRLDDNGPDRIVDLGDDYVIVTDKNVKRSFQLTLFSLIEPRD